MLTGHMHKLTDALYNKKWSSTETRSCVVISGFFLGVLSGLLGLSALRGVWGRLLGLGYALTMAKAGEKGAWIVRNNKECKIDEFDAFCK